MGKNFLASKTLWMNAIALVAASTGTCAGAFTDHPNLVAWLVVIQSVANLVLRFLTKKPVQVRKKTEVASSE